MTCQAGRYKGSAPVRPGAAVVAAAAVAVVAVVVVVVDGVCGVRRVGGADGVDNVGRRCLAIVTGVGSIAGVVGVAGARRVLASPSPCPGGPLTGPYYSLHPGPAGPSVSLAPSPLFAPSRSLVGGAASSVYTSSRRGITLNVAPSPTYDGKENREKMLMSGL